MSEEPTLPKEGYRFVQIQISENDYQDLLKATKRAGYATPAHLVGESLKNHCFQINLFYSGMTMLVINSTTNDAHHYTSDGLINAYEQGEKDRTQRRVKLTSIKGGKPT